CKKCFARPTKSQDAPNCRRSACRTAPAPESPPMRRLAHLLVVAITSLAVPTAVTAAPAAEPLRLGVGLFQPDKDKNDATYRPLADYLSRALERPVQLRTVDSWEGLAK